MGKILLSVEQVLAWRLAALSTIPYVFLKLTDVMTFDQVIRELSRKGSANIKKTLLRHGAQEPLFGVRIGDLKPLQKALKGEQSLALELFATGNSDAMYLAGLIADGALMTRRQLDQWAAGASWHMIAGCPVAWMAAEHPEAIQIGQKWISGYDFEANSSCRSRPTSY